MQSPFAASKKTDVTPLELLFDLVFVFAISQLSHYLLNHLSFAGIIQSFILLVAVYHTWANASWNAVIMGIENKISQLFLLFQMLIGLFFNAKIEEAFGDNPINFVMPLVIGSFSRVIWTVKKAPNALFYDHFRRTSLWMIGINALWLWGMTLPVSLREIVWILAIAIDFIGIWLGHPLLGKRLKTENLPFDAEHMLERNRLFLLIALGESVMSTGLAISHMPITIITMLTGSMALISTIAMWSVLFGETHQQTLYHLEKTNDPLASARLATNLQVFIVIALISLAVANEIVISHPYQSADVSLILLLVGSGLIIRLELINYLFVLKGKGYKNHVIASTTLMILGVVSLILSNLINIPAYILLSVVTILFVLLAICLE